MNSMLNQFFSRSYEMEINENMFYYSYKFPTQEVNNYLESIINIPYSEFIGFIQNQINIFPARSKNIPQFSSLMDCTANICKKIKAVNDPGLSFLDIGKLLLDDGKVRNNGAYIKYGENHSKTAYEFGLTQSKENTWYLSCIGNVFLSFDEESQNAIIARCVLRNRFISRIIADATHNDINIMKYMLCLSKSTMIRRKSNVLSLLNLCISQNKNSDSILFKKIYFKFT